MVRVKEIMKKHVITIEPNETIKDAAVTMTNNRVGSLVIISSERPIGIITESDIVTVISKSLDPKKTKIKDLKRKRFITASPEDNILDVVKKMVKNGIKRMPIVDKDKLVGIVADKEILLISPELIEVMSEKLKARIANVAQPNQVISGICEECGEYSDELKWISGAWLCPDCRE